jgi:hypothetical protein
MLTVYDVYIVYYPMGTPLLIVIWCIYELAITYKRIFSYFILHMDTHALQNTSHT